MSTVSVYGDNPPDLVNEDAPFRQSNDIYTKSKIKAEEICWNYIEKHSLTATIIRPTVVYGPYGPVWTLNPINQLKEKKLVLIDHGNGLCNHLYIDNLIDALFMAAISKQSDGQVYIISDGSAITWKEFLSFYKFILDELGIENGCISLSKEELLDLVKMRKSLLYNFSGIMRTFITNESLNRELDRYRLISGMKELVKNILPAKITEALRGIRESNKPNTGGESMTSTLEPPNPRDITFFSSKAYFSIQKAEKDLGYRPKVGINEGMNIIKQWYYTLF